MSTRARGAAPLIAVGLVLAATGCGSPGPVPEPASVAVDVLAAYRGQNDLVTILPAGALTARPNVYETAWGRAFLDEIGQDAPALDPTRFGEILAASGETPMWQAYYACVAAGSATAARSALDAAAGAADALAEAESALSSVADPAVPAEARALDAIAAIRVLGCLEGADVTDHLEPVLAVVATTGEARLALEVQLHDALEAGPSGGFESRAPVPDALTQECEGVDAYAAAAAVELGRAEYDDVAACLDPYATFLADTQVLHRLVAAGGPDGWHADLVAANLTDVTSRTQDDGIVVGRSNDSGSAGSTLTALRLLRLTGAAQDPVPSWIGEGLARELERVGGSADALDADLVRHACVLADAPCADAAAHSLRVQEVLATPGEPDGRREAYARMAYELGLDVDLDGQVDAGAALGNRDLLCVAAAYELADPGSTGVSDGAPFWDAMTGMVQAGDVVGASCASSLWRAGTDGHGDETGRRLRAAVESRFQVGDDGLWRSDASPAGDLALSLHLYEVIGLA